MDPIRAHSDYAVVEFFDYGNLQTVHYDYLFVYPAEKLTMPKLVRFIMLRKLKKNKIINLSNQSDLFFKSWSVPSGFHYLRSILLVNEKFLE